MAKPKNKRKSSDPSVFVTLVQGEKLISHSYTREEAEQEGIFDPHGYGWLDSGEPEGVEPPGTRCPQCGCSQRDFERSGRLGCSRCVEIFQDALSELLGRMHKGSRHVGKIPRALQSKVEHLQRVAGLCAELEGAIGQEDYERAARLRDALSELSPPS